MRRTASIGLVGVLIGFGVALLVPAAAVANHNLCSPHAVGDDVALWPLNPNGAICRNVIVDSGHGNLMSRSALLARTSLFTSSQARFTPNFLWYSRETTVTITDPNLKWASCRIEPGYHHACSTADVVADFYGSAHLPGRGQVLRAYNFPPSITLSAFEFGGSWIARACGNWKDVPERSDPVPFLDGTKYRDDNRNGARDGGEPPLAGWGIRVTRVSSLVGQGAGLVGSMQTDGNGYYRFDLKEHGPGRYRVEEVVPPGWANYTPIAYDVDVDFGVGDRRYANDFGNAETVADVAKSAMSTDAPDHIDVGTPTDVSVSVTVVNNGPAAQVEVHDSVAAVLPEDCSTPEPTRSFDAVLHRNQPVTRTLTFPITCARPSEHEFRFDDRLAVTRSDITDPVDANNVMSTVAVVPVHAYTDLSTSATLACDPRTDVGVAAECVVDVSVSNAGFGPVDATAAAQLSLPDDCAAVPALATVAFPGLADGASVTRTQQFSVTCSYRSFHEIDVSVAVTPDDRHVFDTDHANDTAGDGPSIMEVFHDATMQVTDVHLVCDESLTSTTFACVAAVTFVKTGPAPMVEVVLGADLAESPDCAGSPDRHQEETFVLDGEDPQTRSFTWAMTCPASDRLHPFEVSADVRPSAREPHAVDQPGPRSDRWVVPYCLPTVNPHGKKQPQAPGSGMNEDGFYEFGTLAGAWGEQVRVRDDGSGTVFGPFPNGTRVKWVEANGATPSIGPMGGNNGNGGGQAKAVDFQIRARGDAQAFFVDEKGVEVSVTCLVPPFPK